VEIPKKEKVSNSRKTRHHRKSDLSGSTVFGGNSFLGLRIPSPIKLATARTIDG
jgi:hypothetical protein